jgi:hypothetical protein
MKQVKLFTGDTLVYDETIAIVGWSTGKVDDDEIPIYIRDTEHGGGVFISVDGDLLHAETGEATVQFNNRLWTTSEEAAEIERIKQDAQD